MGLGCGGLVGLGGVGVLSPGRHEKYPFPSSWQVSPSQQLFLSFPHAIQRALQDPEGGPLGIQPTSLLLQLEHDSSVSPHQLMHSL